VIEAATRLTQARWGGKLDNKAQTGPASEGKAPRTPRGERTLRKILDAARAEFGERGFAESSIVGITQRAGVALGSFYTYFDSKEAVFAEVVRDLSAQVRDNVAPALKGSDDPIDAEARALESFLWFAREHRDVYRLIDEAEFVDPRAYREHYETTASRIAARLREARESGVVSSDYSDEELDVLGWGLMGANVFLGLRFAVWSSSDPKRIAAATKKLLRSGLAK
jgi:AcrR family transcriptional regulator